MTTSEKRRIKNPIIPGFYPDPSIVRVGNDFYLANSSFELYPGIPIFHSKDLAHWEQIGYALTKENGFHVEANMGTGGVMAPTIRYQNGSFYLVCCNFADKGNFYLTAKHPEGPWSEPNWITEIGDIDCSLFFDTDGQSYLVSPGDDRTVDNGRAFYLLPYDLEQNKVCGEKVKIWDSALRRSASPEAPHLYHIGEYYYLMTAEGGTEHYHAVMIARSKTVDGFYEGYPGNPVLTHRNLGWDYPIDNVGHADLVDTPSGKWYAVMLASRTIDGPFKNLGRETYICPVKWERGWPIFSPGSGRIEFEYPADPMLPWTTYKAEPERDDFDENIRDEDDHKLRKYWSFWGTPYQNFWKIEDGYLKLKCLKRPLAEKLLGFQPGTVDKRKDHCVSFVGRRQTSINFEVSCSMKFHAEKKEEAGLIIFQSANHQYRLMQCQRDGRQLLRLVLFTTKQKGLPFLPGYQAETKGDVLIERELQEDVKNVILKLIVQDQNYDFYVGTDKKGLEPVYLHADGREINPEEVGCMTGTMIGMFASANGDESSNEADFDWFEMKNKD